MSTHERLSCSSQPQPTGAKVRERGSSICQVLDGQQRSAGGHGGCQVADEVTQGVKAGKRGVHKRQAKLARALRAGIWNLCHDIQYITLHLLQLIHGSGTQQPCSRLDGLRRKQLRVWRSIGILKQLHGYAPTCRIALEGHEPIIGTLALCLAGACSLQRLQR